MHLDTPVPPSAARPSRHYGLDWLRIGAFGLLIFYHIGMAFSPWRWVIKAPATVDWLTVPMALLTPWRLPLLFAVSGYASRRLYEKSGSVRAFLHSRNRRLLIPLAFGMLVVVPPEIWVRVQEQGYARSLGHFWLVDYWRRGTFFGVELPSWEHLWFVAYLWAYTMVTAALIARPGGAAALSRWLERLDRGDRLLWLPILGLVAAKLALLFVVPEKQGLTTDWAGHAAYLPIFLFGFALGGTDAPWPSIAALHRKAAMLALIAGLVVAGIERTFEDAIPHAMMALDRASRLTMAWSMILLLLHVAQTRWNRDHPLRATLAEAVFPFYIIHHPLIIVTTWYLLPLGLGDGAMFLILLAVTIGGSLAFYGIGRRIRPLRPLIGLGAMPRGAGDRDSGGSRAIARRSPARR
ncbi:MAG: acyltransferase family protein [Sphingomonas sp.]